MKKIIASILFATTIMASGCLKDKDFENQVYGIQDLEGIKGINFVQKSIVTSVTTAATPQTLTAQVGVSSSTAPSSDITYSVVSSPALLPAGITPIPASGFTFSATNTIKAGSKSSPFKITVADGSTLDPNKKYGVAFTLTSVDPGYVIAANAKTVVLTISVQNKYHGNYHSTGYLYHPSSPRAINQDQFLATASANSFTIDLGDLGGAGYRALVTVNPDNSLSIVAAPGAAGGPYTLFTTALPSSNPGYTTVAPGYAGPSNYYDPATKTFYLRYGYSASTGWRVTEEKVVKL